jgi:hypothetical protein
VIVIDGIIVPVPVMPTSLSSAVERFAPKPKLLFVQGENPFLRTPNATSILIKRSVTYDFFNRNPDSKGSLDACERWSVEFDKPVTVCTFIGQVLAGRGKKEHGAFAVFFCS